MALTYEELTKRLDEQKGEKCTSCGIILQECVTGNRNGQCSDCYYEDIGKAIDEQPIAAPMVLRGKK